MGKKSGSGSGMVKKIRVWIRDELPGSYFRELRNNFWIRILKFFDSDLGTGIRNGKNSDLG
jgi:hypothetical protein